MIKRIIFDIDNTLLPWRDEYINSYAKALDELNINYTKDDIYLIDKVIDEYEEVYDIYDRKLLNNFIKSKTNINIPDNFVDIIIKYLALCYKDEDKNIKNVLEYLSNKYELVILSNWFRENQEKRLKALGLDKYFIEMFYTDELLNKPNKESFIKACGDKDVSECVMIGDNYKKDIEGALNAGLDAILLDKNNKYNYKRKIKNINELEDLL